MQTQAVAELDEQHALEGSTAPLAVKWADPDLQVKKRRPTAAEDDSGGELQGNAGPSSSSGDNRMVCAVVT